jgi:hypothetical protein
VASNPSELSRLVRELRGNLYQAFYTDMPRDDRGFPFVRGERGRSIPLGWSWRMVQCCEGLFHEIETKLTLYHSPALAKDFKARLQKLIDAALQVDDPPKPWSSPWPTVRSAESCARSVQEALFILACDSVLPYLDKLAEKLDSTALADAARLTETPEASQKGRRARSRGHGQRMTKDSRISIVKQFVDGSHPARNGARFYGTLQELSNALTKDVGGKWPVSTLGGWRISGLIRWGKVGNPHKAARGGENERDAVDTWNPSDDSQ